MAEYDLSGINVPCNIDAEQSVLGAVLMDSSAMSELATVLQPDHFYVALNRSVYGVMLNMYLAGDKIDIVTVLDAVMRQNIFETPEQAKEYVKMGFYLGIGGVVTFKNAKKLKEVVQEIPLEALVLETDSPYLAPVPHRGKRNNSQNLVYVAEEIAALKGVSYEEVVRQTTENAKKLYRLEK